MASGEAPTFPVLLDSTRQMKWQRSLIPMESADFDGDPADSRGWLAKDGYRVIDRGRRVFSAAYDGSSYAFDRTGSVTDEEVREMMTRNLKSLRRSDHDYIERANLLHAQDLFDFTFRTAN